MAEVVISDLVQHYGNVVAIDGVSLRVKDGELVSLLGPSGCGKSTTLAALAGLERPTSGIITVGDVPFFDSARSIYVPPEDRNCGLVFQSYALWPHMTVFDNCAFALRLRKINRSEQKRRIMEALELVEMQAYFDRYPYQLSGGQQQRVALARTLAYEPAILLLDEPLSNLDAKLRERARTWLRQLQKKVGLTTIFVTHDQSEALSMSDRVAILNGGKIVQFDTPQAIYDLPADVFVADFIGSGALVFGQIEATANDLHTVRLPDEQCIAIRLSYSGRVGERILIAVRPEAITLLGAEAQSSTRTLMGRVENPSYLGARYGCDFRFGETTLRIETDLVVRGVCSDSVKAELADIRYAAFPST